MSLYSYDNLPGTQVATNDGGLLQKRQPRTKSTIVIGTAGKGRADEVYQVVDRAVAYKEFGTDGTLIRAMEEVAQGGCDNIFLFRMGTKPATLVVGKDETHPGIAITFGQRSGDVKSRYRVYFESGKLAIFLDGNLVYSNDSSNPVETGDCDVEVGAVGVTAPIAADNAPANASDFDKSVPLSSDKVAGDCDFGDSGLKLTPAHADYSAREVYEAQAQAFELLGIFPIQQVYLPNCVFDTPNVAYKDDFAKGALGWLKTNRDEEGDLTCTWSDGTTFTSAADRLSKGFHEVSFGYQLARFCAQQSANQGGCFGVIGFSEPKSYKPAGLRNYIGFLPTYDADGNPTVAGKGLCGQPTLVGAVGSQLSSLCVEYGTKGYRIPGLYQTTSALDPKAWGEYDEAPVYDNNGYMVDLGAYIHAVGDWALLRNSFAAVYRGSIAGAVAGLHAALDPKSALTNKPVPGVSQIYRLNMAQLEELTVAKVDMLRFKGVNASPALLHDRTAANNLSDYTFVLRQDIKFLCCDVLFQEADKFIGESSTDGLQLSSLRTAVERRMNDLVKRGYIGGYDYSIHTTNADRRIGRCFINFSFNPPDEAVQIRASVSVGRH